MERCNLEDVQHILDMFRQSLLPGFRFAPSGLGSGIIYNRLQ